MDAAFATLAKDHSGISFQRVEAEEVDEVTEKYAVESVPMFVFLKDGVEVDRLEGADAPSLTRKTAALMNRSLDTAAAAVESAAAAASQPPNSTDVLGRIKYILATHPVVLFMKGTAEAPRCGFSGKVVDALKQLQAPVHCVDILQDQDLRAALKEFSNWPTYPQLHVKGELVGGCDIITEMAASGELKGLLEEKLGSDYARAAAPAMAVGAAAKAAEGGAASGDGGEAAESKGQLMSRIMRLLDSAPVMLFMKGSPEAPRCGFSRKVVDALKGNQIDFSTFDILSDEGIRQGLKEHSNWPTYPQLYVKGELVGGCDIILEMATAGELKSSVEEMMYRKPDA